jgi:hypothetical protein
MAALSFRTSWWLSEMLWCSSSPTSANRCRQSHDHCPMSSLVVIMMKRAVARWVVGGSQGVKAWLSRKLTSWTRWIAQWVLRKLWAIVDNSRYKSWNPKHNLKISYWNVNSGWPAYSTMTETAILTTLQTSARIRKDIYKKKRNKQDWSVNTWYGRTVVILTICFYPLVKLRTWGGRWWWRWWRGVLYR